ncbi:contractile injection system tape measure protein [Leminorella grimontii]|uniref:contractile injection system tape measure protein n=1 Tax=Leminorella grimontii TaxID=82981 RepID=UPI0032205A40
MDNKIHRCNMIMEIFNYEHHKIMTQHDSFSRLSLKYGCENIIREVVGDNDIDINIGAINICLDDFSYGTFEFQFRSRFIETFRKQLTERYFEQRNIKHNEVSQATLSNSERVFSRYLYSGCWPYADKWQQDPASWLVEQLITAQEMWYPFVMSACLQALPRHRLWLLFEQNYVLRHYYAWPKSEANLLLYALRYFQRHPHLQANYLLGPVEKLPLFDCAQAETKQLLTPLLVGGPSISATASSALSLWISALLQQKAVRKLVS